jgi:hypothetical protein
MASRTIGSTRPQAEEEGGIAQPDSLVDEVLRRIGDRLRPHCVRLSEGEVAQLAVELFLEGARFGIEWVET